MGEQIIRPGVPASGRVTPASFPFFTTGEDNLRVTSWNSAAGVRIKVNGRLIDAAGKASPDSWDHTPNTDRSAKSDDITLSGSTILNLTVLAVAGAPLIGQTFVRVQLIRGVGIGAIVLGTILQGYVSTTQAIGWPGSAIGNSIDGNPAIRYVLGTMPAPGASFFEVVPTGARWRVLSFHAFLNTSAAAGTRQATLEIGSPSGRIIDSPQAFTIGPLTGAAFFWVPGMPLTTALTASGPGVAGLPTPCELGAGCAFSNVGTGFAAGDQWNAPVYTVQEWLDI